MYPLGSTAVERERYGEIEEEGANTAYEPGELAEEED